MKKEGIVEMAARSVDMWVMLVEEEELGILGRRLTSFKGVMMIHVFDKMHIFEIIYAPREL